MQTELLCVHIDLETAIDDFLKLLNGQAEEGEDARPAKPENRAIFRELAPFRLLEYAYLSPCEDSFVAGAYFVFADGTTLRVEEDLPESLVDRLVQLRQPAYLYVLLNHGENGKCGRQFLNGLADHLGRSIIGWYQQDDTYKCQCFAGIDWPQYGDVLTKQAASLDFQPMAREQLLQSYRARLQNPNGQCWARVVINYVQYVIVFNDSLARDEFIAWSYGVCDAAAIGRYNVGLVFPAEIATSPGEEVPCLQGVAPSAFEPDPRSWATSDSVADLSAVVAYWNELVNQTKAITHWP